MMLNEYSAKIGIPELYLVDHLGVEDDKKTSNATLTIPYFDQEQTLVFKRYRKGVERWCDKGAKPTLYGLWLLDASGDVILCEGESDTQTLLFNHFNALGLPSSTTFHDDWFRYFESFKNIYICLDNDGAGRKGVEQLTRKLTSLGFQGALKIIDIQKFKDINELYRDNESAFKDIFEKLKGQAREILLPPATDLEWESKSVIANVTKEEKNDDVKRFAYIDLASVTASKQKYLIEMFLPKGHITSLYGHGGSGKSILALSIAICVAAGKPFLGLHASKGKVLYVDFEMNQYDQSDRLKEICHGLNISTDEVRQNLKYMDRSVFPADSQFEDVIKGIGNDSFDLIIIDSVGASLKGDQESAKDATRYLSSLLNQGTILLLDHQTKKASEGSSDTASQFGSVYKFNLSRNVWHAKLGNQDSQTITTELINKKNNFGPLRNMIEVCIGFEKSKISISGSSKDHVKPVDIKLDDTVIADLKKHARGTADEIAQRTGKNKRTLQNCITQLRSDNRINVAGKKGNASIYELVITDLSLSDSDGDKPFENYTTDLNEMLSPKIQPKFDAV